MKKLKRSLSLLLSFAMIFVMAPIQTFAASKTISIDSKTVEISKTQATQVILPVNITDDGNGITSFQLKFDMPDGWNITDIEDQIYDEESDTSEYNIFYTKKKPYKSLAVVVTSFDTTGEAYNFATAVNDKSDLDANGVMCWITFEIPANEVNGKYDISLIDTIINNSSSSTDNLAGNYAFTPATITVTGGSDKLTSANTEISGINASYEYTGSPITPEPTVVYNGKTLGSGTDYTVSYKNNTNIGTATLTVTGAGSYLGSIEKTFEITKTAAEIKIPTTSYTKKYGEPSFSLGATVNSGAALSYVSDKPEVASVDAEGNVTIVGAGTATITVSAPETENYKKPADKKVTVTVSQADQKVTGPDNISKTYADADFDLGAGIDPATGAMLTYKSSDTKVVSIDNAGKVSVNGVGSATITVTASEIAGKYNTAEKKIPVTVAAKELTVNGITAKSKTYDGKTTAEFVYPAAIDGVKAGDTVTVTAKGEFADANAGTDKTVNITDIKLGGVSAANYILAKSGNQTATTANITKAAYTDAISAEATVPANKAITGRTLDISAFKLPAGFVGAKITDVKIGANNDALISGTPTVASSGTAISYDIAATASDKIAEMSVTISSQNYEDVTAKVTLTSKAVTLDWTKYFTAKDSVVYGTARSEMFSKSATAGTAADAEEKALAGTFEIVGAAEKPVVSADNQVTVNFTVTADGDYKGVVLTNTYKIPVTAKEIELTWNDAAGLVYDGAEKNVTATATGLVSNDQVTVTVTGGNGKNAGKYTATAAALAGSAAGNYKLPASVTKEYTIEKADYKVTLSSESVSVKEGTESTAFLPTASAKGVADEAPTGELKFYSDSARSKELTAADVKAMTIGDHNIYWSFKTTDTNYKDAAKTGTVKLTITDGDPQNIAISGIENKTYGDAAFKAGAAVTTTNGAAVADSGAITWSSSDAKVAEIDAATGMITIKGAGETTITAKAAKVPGKYAEGTQTAKLTVAKKVLTIDSITAENKTYDGTKAAKLTAKVSGAVTGDTVTVSAEGEFADVKVGVDKEVKVTSIKLDEASAANYALPETIPAVKASIKAIAEKDVKIEYPNLSQNTGNIAKPVIKLTPEDPSATVKIFIKKTEKDATTGETKETTVEWTDKTAPTSAGTYTIFAEITSDNIDGKITTPEQKLTITQRSSGGGGGSAAVTTYKVNIDKVTNGTVKSSASLVEKGKTVTITATPADGYETASVKVTDASGKNVDVTKNSDGTYKFTMPAGNVTVKAEFAKKAENDTVCADMKDIDQSKWYHEAVHYVVEKGIMNGYSKDEFGPNDTLSRAMLAQILYNNAGKPSAKGASYNDLASTDWFAAAVNWASENNIVTGFADGTFRPNDSITREQLAVMLYRYAGQPATTGGLSGYTDASSVSPYAEKAMQWATAAGIITGNGNAATLDPKGQATRAQAAAMIMRYLEKK